MFAPEPALSLKSAADFNFDPSAADFYRKSFPGMYGYLSGGSSWSNEVVTVATALQHPAVWACNRVISESIGFIPAVLMQAKGNEKRVAEEHPFYSAMKNAPSEEITAQCFTEMLTSHCLLQGNGYAQIVRRSGTGIAIELRQLMPECVFPDREKAGQKRLVYVVKTKNEADRTYTVEAGRPQDILHLRGLGWDGLRGYPVVQMGRNSIGTAIAAERNAARFWANGGRVPYNLKLNQKFANDQASDKFRADWETIYSDPHKVPILEPWFDYQQTGMSMVDAQALESRQAAVAEICRWFSVSPHLIADLSRATFSNIEHLTLEFVKMTLTAWLNRWEQEIWRSVLTAKEKADGYFLRHNVNALLRGDFQTRMAGYAQALQNGFLNVDEVRDLEDRNPLPNDAGKSYHYQLNMQTTPGTGQPSVVEQGILARAAGNSAKPATQEKP